MISLIDWLIDWLTCWLANELTKVTQQRTRMIGYRFTQLENYLKNIWIWIWNIWIWIWNIWIWKIFEKYWHLDLSHCFAINDYYFEIFQHAWPCQLKDHMKVVPMDHYLYAKNQNKWTKFYLWALKEVACPVWGTIYPYYGIANNCFL